MLSSDVDLFLFKLVVDDPFDLFNFPPYRSIMVSSSICNNFSFSVLYFLVMYIEWSKVYLFLSASSLCLSYIFLPTTKDSSSNTQLYFFSSF